MTTPPAPSDSLRLLRSTLAADHLEHSVALAVYHGAEVPLGFSDVHAEHRAVRAAAGLLDFSFRSKFTLSGEHRVRFLHRIVSNDVKSLSTGQGTYATLLNAQGRILADLRIYADADRLWVDTDADLAEKAMNILRRYIVGDRVEVEPQAVYAVALQGPVSRGVLREVLSGSLDGLDREMDHQVAEYEGSPVRVVRLSSTGEDGYEVWLDDLVLRRFWFAACEAGADMGLIRCGTEALESLRIEAGIPRYGPDLGEDTLALEAGLLNALSFNKGCYIGQEIVERARTRGHVNWKLMGLQFEPAVAVPKPGQQLMAEGKPVGEVTSACFSPTWGRPLALAYVRREVSEPGTRLLLSNGEAAEVTALPFLEPKFARSHPLY
ncbi:MAG TPA: aminomethyltransferase family protein [Terriglobia bacterium]